jgi:hypothetical protein
VEEITSHSQRAQTQSRTARELKPINVSERLSFSPKEFSEANGKSTTWGYRQIYSGKVKVISDSGRMLIPRSEVDRFLARATEYNPKSKATIGTGENGGEA